MKTYRLPECKLWDVVLKGRGKSVVWAGSLTWEAARRELQKVLRDFVGDDFSWCLDAGLVPVGPRRPWTEATLGAYLRVMAGPTPATQLLQDLRERADGDDLTLALTGVNEHMLHQMGFGG